METKEKKKFNKHAFISVAMFIAVISLACSGIINHTLQFEQFTTGKHFWMSAHNISAFLFILFATLHIKYNWHSLLRYTKKIKELKISKEAILAIVVVIFIVGLISSHAFLVR